MAKTHINKACIFCFSHLRWDFVWQRPQHLLTRAAQNFPVFFFEEPIYDGGSNPSLEVSDRGKGISVVIPHVPAGTSSEAAVAAQRDLIRSFIAPWPDADRLFWYYTPMALDFTQDLARRFTIFDVMDELSAFRGASPELLAREAELLARADVVFTGGFSLYEAKKDRHPNVHLFPSSVDTAHFARARQGLSAEPEGEAGLPHPRLGYFGVIDERLDLDLLAGMADARPDWAFVMVGPTAKIDPADLPRRANLHWLGARPYAALPGHLAAWDIGIMPFAINAATRFISPTKTPEFLAAGIPVLSTPVRDVVRGYGEEGLVEIVTDAASAIAAAEHLLARPRSPWLEAVDCKLAASSWDATWAAMAAQLPRISAPPAEPSDSGESEPRSVQSRPFRSAAEVLHV